MKEKYVGLRLTSNARVVPFRGGDYCIVLVEGDATVFYLHKTGERMVADGWTKRSVQKFIKRGEWGIFSRKPFSFRRGNQPSTTPYGGCP